MNKKRRIYLVISIIVLMLAVTGATYAYYTSFAVNDNAIGGNMADIDFNLTVVKKTNVDEVKGGLIPMTNAMVEAALSNSDSTGICVDNNDNPVCQIYKIIVTNNSTTSMFVDGYVTLTGGSGEPLDYPTSPTTMRWAQVFCTESSNNISSCTTAGAATSRQTSTISWNALGTGTGHDTAEIKDSFNNVVGMGTISGNDYNIINTNYIRVSNHSNGSTYIRENDVTSALVYNQYLLKNDNNSSNNTGDSSSTYTDSQVYYIVVWLSETGHNQTAGSGGTSVPNLTDNFFQGNATFISSQGNQVTATFGGYAKAGIQQAITRETYYTVNIYNSDDEENTLVWLNQAIPNAITKHTTVTAARNAFSNRPFYLKHILENNIVKESYVEFIVTPEMATANPGMIAGTYALRGLDTWDTTNNQCKSEYYDSVNDSCLSPYYALNVNVLKQAFGENSGYCSDFTSSSDVNCGVSGLRADAYSDGGVGASGDSAGCGVGSDGSSYCGEWGGNRW